MNSEPTYAYFLGASWSGEDQTDRFLAEGIWEHNQSDEHYLEAIRGVQPGDRVAIKSSYVVKNDLPFYANGKSVSCMLVKARGTVVSNPGNGKILNVNWDSNFIPRPWYFFVSRKTIWKVEAGDWKHDMLLDFAFNDGAQDISLFISDPFWADRYGIDGLVSGQTEESAPSVPYTEADFLDEVFLASADFRDLQGLLKNKKNVILQGAPGTGKTFAAKRIAYAVMGFKDDSRIEVVQFHQNTSYDEFVIGYKPNEAGGFDICDGVFLEFCSKAAVDRNRDYFFIIDEINRANISKVFGELLMLIEENHRGECVKLTADGRMFSVPENVFIIGMMNTADRGLALIDYALRRRFAFYKMKPALEHPGFISRISSCPDARMRALVDAVVELNEIIKEDPALGEGYCIGHSYFCKNTPNCASPTVRYELVPLIEEYWFDDPKKAQRQIKKLEAVL